MAMTSNAPSSTRKARRKRKDHHLSATTPEFPLAAFLWPARANVSQWVLLPLILMVVGLFRWATGFWPYSGFQAPPLHGDFEAQRHWMELTIHLPISQWYFHNLQWWGLDYPPLTAYHSWVLGKLGNRIDPSWFELHKSRGLDDSSLKIFMRATVLASEYLVYIPAAVVVVRRLARIEAVNHWESSIALVAILMQPSTLLIDHGHFQYNTVMLGLSLATISSMLAGNLRWACVFFVGALGFKQMALFYAPAVFAYLLSLCVTPRINFTRFISIGLVTVLAFGLLFAPLLLGAMYDSYRGISVDEYEEPPLLSKTPIHLDHKAFLHSPIVQLAQSIHRIFPFARGLFEDKVANAWCALHTVHKLNKYQSSLVQRAALLATTSAIIPPCLILFLKPRKELLPLAFASTAWGFFLFSYQVHEKNILLPLMPMTFLLATHDGLLPYTRAWVGFANTLASWTLYPLLRRDGLQVPFFVLTLLWAFILGLPPVSFAAYVQGDSPGRIGILTTVFHIALYLAMVGWHFVYAFVPPPVSKPDLWVVANVIIGAGGFGVCYLWCLYTLAHKAGYYGAVVPQKKIQ